MPNQHSKFCMNDTNSWTLTRCWRAYLYMWGNNPFMCMILVLISLEKETESVKEEERLASTCQEDYKVHTHICPNAKSNAWADLINQSRTEERKTPVKQEKMWMALIFVYCKHRTLQSSPRALCDITTPSSGFGSKWSQLCWQLRV